MQNSIKFNKIDNKISVHGLDIGNATCDSDTRIIFDSKITEIEPLTKANKMVSDGKTYWLGEGNLDTTYKKVDKKHYIDMMYGLLALSTDTVHNYICLGLPLSQYKEDKAQLINMVMNNNNKIVKINDSEKPLIIDDIEVFPEGVATLQDDYEGIVIDVGGLTTDCALVTNERGRRKITNPISIASGTINLYTDFINKLNNKYSLNLKIDDAERILTKGLLLDGKKEDIDFALRTYTDYVDGLISELQVNYSIRTNYISLTGGGATILHKQLKTKLGDGLTLQDDSIFANAKAFYELGLSVFGED